MHPLMPSSPPKELLAGIAVRRVRKPFIWIGPMDTEARTIEYIKALATSRWGQIWAAGGKIRERSTSIYEGDLVVRVGETLIGLGAYATTDEHRVEHYQIYAEVERAVGTEESERMHRPARREVTEFPENLPLAAFIQSGAARCTILRDSVEGRSLLVGALFERGSARLLFFADDDIPESLIVTSDDGEIAARIRETDAQFVFPSLLSGA